jgi:hypothetical protein
MNSLSPAEGAGAAAERAHSMPNLPAARAAALDLLGLLTGVRDRLNRAQVRRGKPARLAVWREVLGDRSADAFPRQLAHGLRAAKAQVAPVLDALRAARTDGPYPAGDAPVQAATAAGYVLAVAAEMVDRLNGGLPRSPTRSWIADDEVADLGRQLDPFVAALPADLPAHVAAEFAAVGQ